MILLSISLVCFLFVCLIKSFIMEIQYQWEIQCNMKDGRFLYSKWYYNRLKNKIIIFLGFSPNKYENYLSKMIYYGYPNKLEKIIRNVEVINKRKVSYKKIVIYDSLNSNLILYHYLYYRFYKLIIKQSTLLIYSKCLKNNNKAMITIIHFLMVYPWISHLI